jgi:hypothetical protein
MLAGDGPFFHERRLQMKECLYQANWHKNIKAFYESITVQLLKKWSFKVDGTTSHVDIIRDVGNSGEFLLNLYQTSAKLGQLTSTLLPISFTSH